MWRRCRPSWKPTRATPLSGQCMPSTTSTGECALAWPAEDLKLGPQNPAAPTLGGCRGAGFGGKVGVLLRESTDRIAPTLPEPEVLRCTTVLLLLLWGHPGSLSALWAEGRSCGDRPLEGRPPSVYSFLFSRANLSASKLPPFPLPLPWGAVSWGTDCLA